MYKTTSRNIQRRRDRRKTKRTKMTASTGLYRVRPVDKIAALVMTRPRKPKPNLAKLRKKAALTSDPDLRDVLLKQVAMAEARSKAAKKAANTRLTAGKAVEKAQRALERAKWYRENG